MALPVTKPKSLPLAEERRRHQRVKVNLLGRYMLADRREFPCQVVNMSPGGIAVVAPVAGNPGERVIAYIDHLGRLEGKIARRLDNGFAMTIEATLRHIYFEETTHLYNIQRLKRAQGLPTLVEVPRVGYWVVDGWDRSEP